MKTKYQEQAAFFFIFGKLCGSGYSLYATLDVLSSEPIPERLRKIAAYWQAQLKTGQFKISGPAAKKEFAPWVLDLLALGEKGGNLDVIPVTIAEILQKMGEFQ